MSSRRTHEPFVRDFVERMLRKPGRAYMIVGIVIVTFLLADLVLHAFNPAGSGSLLLDPK